MTFRHGFLLAGRSRHAIDIDTDDDSPAFIADFIAATLLLECATDQWLRGEIDKEALALTREQANQFCKQGRLYDLDDPAREVRKRAQEVLAQFDAANERYAWACSAADFIPIDASPERRRAALEDWCARLESDTPWLPPLSFPDRTP